MFSRTQLDWIQERKGQLKVQLQQGRWRLIAEWYHAESGERLELSTCTDDRDWWQKVQDLDRLTSFQNPARVHEDRR